MQQWNYISTIGIWYPFYEILVMTQIALKGLSCNFLNLWLLLILIFPIYFIQFLSYHPFVSTELSFSVQNSASHKKSTLITRQERVYRDGKMKTLFFFLAESQTSDRSLTLILNTRKCNASLDKHLIMSCYTSSYFSRNVAYW